MVSTDTFHRAHHACFGAMIATARNKRDMRPDDIAISDLAGAGLPRPCVIRLSRLATFEWSDQIRAIGALGAPERPPVIALLKRWFAI